MSCQYYSAEPMSNLTTLQLSARVKVIWELMSWRKLKSNAKSMSRYCAADAKRFWKFCTVKVCWVAKVVGYHAKPMSPMESAPKMLSQNVNEKSITNVSRRMRSLWQDTAKLMSKFLWKFCGVNVCWVWKLAGVHAKPISFTEVHTHANKWMLIRITLSDLFYICLHSLLVFLPFFSSI